MEQSQKKYYFCRKISDKELKGLARFFNITTDELLKEDD